MTVTIRGLISQGNQKLGGAIHHFDLRAIADCPGRTSICERVCYATRSRFRFPNVRDKLQANYDATLRDDFVDRMVAECLVKGVMVLRWHCSGDVYSASYAEKMLAVMQRTPKVKHYLYSRSFRCDDICTILEQMALLPNVRMWWSCDADVIPSSVPKGVRLAFLLTREGEEPQLADLLFRVKRLRKKPTPKLALPVLTCPAETAAGQGKIVCGTCRHCFT